MSTLVDPVVWESVRGRRGPSRWVVIAAILVSVLVVGTASAATSRGLASPGLTSDGSSSEWFASTSTAIARVRLYNTSQRDVTVVGATVVRDDGSAAPYARIAAVPPTTVPAGTRPDPYDESHAVPLTLSVELDCPSALADGSGANLLLTTTGTWPEHDVTVSFMDIVSWCDVPEDGA